MGSQMLYVKKEGEPMAKAGQVFSKDDDYYTPRYVVNYFTQMDLIMILLPAKKKQ